MDTFAYFYFYIVHCILHICVHVCLRSAYFLLPKDKFFLTYLSKYSTYVNRLINDNLKAIVNLSKCIQLLTLWKVPSSVSIWNKDICLYSGTLKSILITRWLVIFQKLNSRRDKMQVCLTFLMKTIPRFVK